MQFEADTCGSAKSLSDDENPHIPDTSVDLLRDELEKGKRELVQLSKNGAPSATALASLEETLAVAKKALRACRETRSSVRKSAVDQATLIATWNELQKRRRFLQELKATVDTIQRLRAVAQAVCDARSSSDQVRMTESCLLFESLNATHPKQFDHVFLCLHSVSDRVAAAVAQSMRTLRASLRGICRRFDPVTYAKCVRDFRDLGAQSHFPPHLLQVFEEEAVSIFEDAIALEARPSQKIMSFFSMLGGLLSQFVSVIGFHRQIPRELALSAKDEQLFGWIRERLMSYPLPFSRLGSLSVTFISELKVSLVTEQTRTLLHVFDSSLRLCKTVVAAKPLSFDDVEETIRFRASRRASSREIRGTNLSDSKVVALRRGRSQSDLGRVTAVGGRRMSGRQIWKEEFEKPISKAVKMLALGHLSTIHMRHVEELSVLINSATSWVRVRLCEQEIKTFLQELFEGIEGRIRTGGVPSAPGELNTTSQDVDKLNFLDIDAKSMTFTTASLSMLRWMSVYFTIGFAAPLSLSEALSNVTDLFLVLLQVSVDRDSRLGDPEQEPFLQSLEDMVLERPEPKSISDFLHPSCRKLFRTFENRYLDLQPSVGEAEMTEMRKTWSSETYVSLPRFSFAVGRRLSEASFSRQGMVEQCVAIEDIGTMCEVIDRFSLYVDRQIQDMEQLSKVYESQRMVSLRSALSLGREVRRAFYKLLAWDIVGGWDAISAVAETCRRHHSSSMDERDVTASHQSKFVDEILQRILLAYSPGSLPPAAAETIAIDICEMSMEVILEGVSRVQICTDTAAASQLLLDLHSLDLALVEHTGLHPCPGRERTEMYVKAMFLEVHELDDWIDRHRRRLQLTDAHVSALVAGKRVNEIPIVDQIITL